MKPTPTRRKPASDLDAAAIDARGRARITAVRPQVDGGRYPVRRTVGESVAVEADIVTDGHDQIGAALRYRRAPDAEWSEACLAPFSNDAWRGEFAVDALTPYVYTVEAWIDRFATWARDLEKRLTAKQDVRVDLQIGARLVEETAKRAAKIVAVTLTAAACLMAGADTAVAAATALNLDLAALMRRWDPRRFATRYERELRVDVDPPYALQQLVRDVSPLVRRGSRQARHVGRLRAAIVVRRLDGVRRVVSAAHPSNWPFVPQREEQRDKSRERRCRKSMGHWRCRGRPHGRPPRTGHAG